MLKDNLEKVFSDIRNGNNFGEEIALVGATKTKTVEEINEAIGLGLKIVAENKVQEFKEKTDRIVGATQHFIGHLQTNKVKYLVGKVDLIHSVDSIRLAEEIDKCAKKIGVTQNILLEINIGSEPSKSGFFPQDFLSGYEAIKKLSNVKIVGLMTMLPISDDREYIESLCKKMRTIFDELRKTNPDIKNLSMGISGDYKIAIQNGSNMIRLGQTIFGERKKEEKL